MKTKEISKIINYELLDNKDNDEIYHSALKKIDLANLLLNKKVDIYSEFILHSPEDYEEYKLYHLYTYNTKTLLTEQEFYFIMEALNDLK